MRGVPYSDNGQCEWETRIATIGGQAVTLVQPIAVTPTTSVNVPSLSIGANPTFTVGTIKRTVAEILGDEVHAPITCQALLESANTAVIGSTVGTGYHALPPSGRKIHEHLIPFRNFYQTSNNNKTDVNSVPSGSHTLLADTGLARDAGDYKQYNGWKTQGNVFTNTDTSMFDVHFVIFQILLFATLCHVRIHVRFQIFNPILLTRKSFTFSLTRPLFNKDHFEVFPSSIISDNSVYVIIICIRVIFTIMHTIVLMVLSSLNKVGSMTHITQVDIRVYVYNFIYFSLTIVKSFFGH